MAFQIRSETVAKASIVKLNDHNAGNLRSEVILDNLQSNVVVCVVEESGIAVLQH